MKKIIILCLFLLSIFCFAQGSYAENFYIKNYDVILDVDKYKNVEVSEIIDAFFTTSSHGIFRTIPTENGDYIDNIRVNKQNTVNKSFNSTTIKIGNPDRLVNGEEQYIIQYTYHINDKKNEFYFNIIGTEWNTDINKVNFKIIMPDDVEPDKVGLSIGRYGTRGFKDIAQYNVNENIIRGTTNVKLSPNEGVTIRIEVPEGYFKQSPFEKLKPLINIAIVLLLTVVSFGMWYKYGRDEHVTPVVSFCPPEGLNSARVGVLYKETADVKDVVSLLFYLASKGYIKIIDKGNDFSIEKLKEYDGNVDEERELMNALFDKKTSIMSAFNPSNVVTQNDLKHSETFYMAVNNIVSSLETYKKNMMTTDSVNFKNQFIMWACAEGIAFSIFYAFCNYSFGFLSLKPEGLGVFCILFVFSNVFFLVVSRLKTKFIKILLPAIMILIPGIPASAYTGVVLPQAWIIIVQLVCLMIAVICWQNFSKWSEEGVAILGQIFGFKHFLDVAEKHKIEELSQNNPNYAFDMIAFAYVLGISAKWMKILENMMIMPPEWYHGDFNRRAFDNFSNNFYSISVPSTENGGITSSSSSGGGGFSGGGCGGGGGGSW